MKHIFVRPQPLISILTELGHNFSLELLARSLVITLGIFSGLTIPASAQIIYEGGKAATQAGNTINIPVTEGKPSGDGTNLFHSFDKFNVKAGDTANFIATPGIQNILGRVNGSNGGSLIEGTLRVSDGGNNRPAVNLFLMNPAGIVFGNGASLDINGAFTATTAKAIEFRDGKWFNAIGKNTVTELKDNPIGLAFTGGTPGSIVSAATLSNIKPGKSITLVGGTVISTGDIKTAGGNISIATVEGGKYVQIQSDGSILRLNLPASAGNIAPQARDFNALSLPGLLTNTGIDLAATGVKNEKGVVTLVGDQATIASDINRGDTVSKQNRSISSGDVITRDLDTESGGKSGNVYIDAGKAIIARNINTKARSSGGTVVLNAQTQIKTAEIDSSASDTSSVRTGGDVTLSTQTSDIIVDSIKTEAGSTNVSGFNEGIKGGNVTVKSAGLFRLIEEGIQSSLSGIIKIKYGNTKPFVSGIEVKFRPFDGTPAGNVAVSKTGFTFPDGASGSRGSIVTSRNGNGTVNVVFQNQSIVTSPFTNDPAKNSGDGKTGTELAKNTSGDNSEEPDSTSQASKQKAKCKNSSAIASAKLGTDPTRSGNSASAAAEEFCLPDSNSGILQILTDRN